MILWVTMKCGRRALTLASLAFGLGATGALALAVATDFWLYTTENLATIISAYYPSSMDMGGGLPVMDEAVEDMDYNMSLAEYGPGGGQEEIPNGDYPDPSFTVTIHSGLWRACILYNMPVEGECPSQHSA